MKNIILILALSLSFSTYAQRDKCSVYVPKEARKITRHHSTKLQESYSKYFSTSEEVYNALIDTLHDKGYNTTHEISEARYNFMSYSVNVVWQYMGGKAGVARVSAFDLETGENFLLTGGKVYLPNIWSTNQAEAMEHLVNKMPDCE